MNALTTTNWPWQRLLVLPRLPASPQPLDQPSLWVVGWLHPLNPSPLLSPPPVHSMAVATAPSHAALPLSILHPSPRAEHNPSPAPCPLPPPRGRGSPPGHPRTSPSPRCAGSSSPVRSAAGLLAARPCRGAARGRACIACAGILWGGRVPKIKALLPGKPGCQHTKAEQRPDGGCSGELLGHGCAAPSRTPQAERGIFLELLFYFFLVNLQCSLSGH